MVVDEKLQPEALLAPRSSKSLGLRLELQKLKVWILIDTLSGESVNIYNHQLERNAFCATIFKYH